MYLPEHFAQTDPAEIAAILHGAPLAAVVAQTRNGLIANHLPLLTGADGTLIGHVARANDMHRIVAEGQEVLAIFRGGDAYVSANDYPSKAETHRSVPTWNYEAVHVSGTITFQHDEKAKRAAVGLLTRLHETRTNGASGWRMADAPADYMQGMLANIVAFRIAPSRVLAKSKLGQNRTAPDRQGAAEGVRRRGNIGLAERMTKDNG